MFFAHHNGIVNQQSDAGDSAINVSALSVKPRHYSAMKVATTEIGSVSAVITVLRHDAEEQENDDDRQHATLNDGALDAINVGLHVLTDQKGWSVRCRWANPFQTVNRPALTPTPASTVLLPRTEHVERLVAPRQYGQKLVRSLLPPSRWWQHRQPHLQDHRGGQRPDWRSPTPAEQASHAHRFVVLADGDVADRCIDIVIAGAASNWSTPMRRARSLATSGSIWISRVEEPLILTVATPVTFSCGGG